MIAGNAVTVISLNIHVPSRGSLSGNYVINPIWADQNIYKMDEGEITMIAAGCVIIKQQKKTRKNCDGG